MLTYFMSGPIEVDQGVVRENVPHSRPAKETYSFLKNTPSEGTEENHMRKNMLVLYSLLCV